MKEEKGTNKTKKPWPTNDVMRQVYKLNLWGGEASNFYSGEGSHNPTLVTPYITAVASFLRSFKNPLVVCDLGCGDFNVGKELVPYAKKFIAVDIVEELITYNRKTFKENNLEFQCLDISADKLPSGDCAILRQVLQHVSNAEIKSILTKLTDFKYVIITEHIPEGDYTPNTDIISGQGIRLKKQSGVNVLAPPFNFKVIEEKQLVSSVLNNGKGIILTTLYHVF